MRRRELYDTIPLTVTIILLVAFAAGVALGWLFCA